MFKSNSNMIVDRLILTKLTNVDIAELDVFHRIINQYLIELYVSFRGVYYFIYGNT
jgi:hypothetical protein